uniref:Uncharacterized protein n=1 Tax=Oryza barthii TaxID=65489 RepID=A0A0D3FZV7_9ORYZ
MESETGEREVRYDPFLPRAPVWFQTPLRRRAASSVLRLPKLWFLEGFRTNQTCPDKDEGRAALNGEIDRSKRPAPLLTSQKQVARDSKYTIVNDQRKAATKVQQAARGPASNRKQQKNPEPSEMRSVAGRTCKAASRNEFSDAYGPDRSQQADTYEMKASKWSQTK